MDALDRFYARFGIKPQRNTQPQVGVVSRSATPQKQRQRGPERKPPDGVTSRVATSTGIPPPAPPPVKVPDVRSGVGRCTNCGRATTSSLGVCTKCADEMSRRRELAVATAAPQAKARQFQRQCTVRDAATGSCCKLLAPHEGFPHRTERGVFHQQLVEGTTPYLVEQLTNAALSNPAGGNPTDALGSGRSATVEKAHRQERDRKRAAREAAVAAALAKREQSHNATGGPHE
jgi:hypothetical protein